MTSKQLSIQWKIAALGVQWLLGVSLLSHGQCGADESLFLFGTNPRLILTADTQEVREWTLQANANSCRITDLGFSSDPFVMDYGARNNSIYIGVNGLIGFGTSAPQRELHIVGSNAPAIRLEQDTSGGFPARAWSIEANDQNFMIHDVGPPNRRPFKVQAGAPNDALILHSSGRVGVGTAAPDVNSQMEVRSTSLNGLLLKRTTADSNYLRLENSAGAFRTGVQASGDTQFGALTAGKSLYLVAGGTGKLLINASGQFSFGNPPPAIPPTDAMMTGTGAHLTLAGVWTDNSSRATKQDIEPISSEQARETVLALQPMTYRYKVQPEEPYAGFIAEDVPELVATSNRKSLAPMDFVAVLTKVVQDQDRELSEERQKNEKERQRGDKLERLVDSLTQRMADLEQRLEGMAAAK